jgi:hypothetical protein
MSHFLRHFALGMTVKDKTEETVPVNGGRSIGEHLLLVVFLCIAVAATAAWLGAIGWASWRLIDWLSP